MVDVSADIPKSFLSPEAREIVVPERRKRLWAVLVDLYLQFDKVCKKHGIRYFCDGGTLLGAARHRGFIPWDDDFDVVMSREEYEKLNKIAPQEFKMPYFWQTNETDPASARGHAQLRNSATTGILKDEMCGGKPLNSFNQGMFIDVFPFDNIPDDPAERCAFIARLKKLKQKVKLIKGIREGAKRRNSRLPTPGYAWRLVKAFCLRTYEVVLRRDALTAAEREFEQAAMSYRGVQTDFKAPLTLRPDHREVLPSDFFDESTELDFEFLKVPVMKRYKEVLEINYGNWREQVIGTGDHGGLFVDLDNSYLKYVGDAR